MNETGTCKLSHVKVLGVSAAPLRELEFLDLWQAQRAFNRTSAAAPDLMLMQAPAVTRELKEILKTEKLDKNAKDVF